MSILKLMELFEFCFPKQQKVSQSAFCLSMDWSEKLCSLCLRMLGRGWSFPEHGHVCRLELILYSLKLVWRVSTQLNVLGDRAGTPHLHEAVNDASGFVYSFLASSRSNGECCLTQIEGLGSFFLEGQKNSICSCWRSRNVWDMFFF